MRMDVQMDKRHIVYTVNDPLDKINGKGYTRKTLILMIFFSMNTRMAQRGMLALATLALIGAGCAGRAPAAEKKTDAPKNTETSSELGGSARVEENGEGPSTVRGDVRADVSAKTDCGGDTACFEKKFASCESATMELSVGEVAMYVFEILGPKSGQCEMRTRYTKHPDRRWIGKDMTCVYDNKKPFQQASEELTAKVAIEKNRSVCAGALAELILGS